MQMLNTLAVRAIPWIPRAVIQRISRRYIAGSTLHAALQRAAQLNAQGFPVSLGILGESAPDLARAQAAADACQELLGAIAERGLQAHVAVKPTALGLLLDAPACERLIGGVLDGAVRHGGAVCLDMEDVRCTDQEIELFKRLRERSDRIGLALQAYLPRTYQDIEPLVRSASTLRICKGIYAEDPAHLVPIARSDRNAINEHFLRHVVRCFEAGSFVGIATHDAALIEQIVEEVRRRHVEPARFEFQMLLGVCEPLRDRLRAMGFSVRIYVPFGQDWHGYSTRRMKENPRIAGYVARALIGL